MFRTGEVEVTLLVMICRLQHYWMDVGWLIARKRKALRRGKCFLSVYLERATSSGDLVYNLKVGVPSFMERLITRNSALFVNDTISIV